MVFPWAIGFPTRLAAPATLCSKRAKCFECPHPPAGLPKMLATTAFTAAPLCPSLTARRAPRTSRRASLVVRADNRPLREFNENSGEVKPSSGGEPAQKQVSVASGQPAPASVQVLCIPESLLPRRSSTSPDLSVWMLPSGALLSQSVPAIRAAFLPAPPFLRLPSLAPTACLVPPLQENPKFLYADENPPVSRKGSRS